MSRSQQLTERDGPRALHGELLGPAVEPGAQVAPNGFALRLAAVHIVGSHVAHHPREAREGARLLQHLYVHLVFKVNSGGCTKRTNAVNLLSYHFFMLSSSSLIRAASQSHGRKTQTLLNKQARGLISAQASRHTSQVTLFLFVPHKWMRITLVS